MDILPPMPGHSLLINSSLIPDEELLTHVNSSENQKPWFKGNKLLAGILNWQSGLGHGGYSVSKFNGIIPYNIPFRQLHGPLADFSME